MANVIITIHGLGNKPPKQLLEEWWRSALLEGLECIKAKMDLPKTEMVYWADIMYDKPLDSDETDVNSPLYLDEKYIRASAIMPAGKHELRQKIVDFIRHQLKRVFLNEDFSLNYGFITDAIVRKYFRDLEVYYAENCTLENQDVCKVKDVIRERLLNVLEKHKKDRIMLISHSMGSIIAFDVLTFLAPHIPVHTFVTMGSPLGLPIVVSKIVAEQKQRMNGETHMVTPVGVYKHWYNFSDLRDRVAFSYRLADDFSENKQGVKPLDMLVVNNYEIGQIRNPHKSFGYLRTTEFAKVLDEFIRSDVSTGEKLWQSTSRTFEKVKTNISNQAKKLKERYIN